MCIRVYIIYKIEKLPHRKCINFFLQQMQMSYLAEIIATYYIYVICCNIAISFNAEVNHGRIYSYRPDVQLSLSAYV